MGCYSTYPCQVELHSLCAAHGHPLACVSVQIAPDDGSPGPVVEPSLVTAAAVVVECVGLREAHLGELLDPAA